MNIIDFTLKNYRLYSPFTGELLRETGIRGVNLNAKALAGYWEFDSHDYHDYYECWYDSENDDFFHVFHVITINNMNLSKAFDKYLVDFSRKAQDMEGEIIFSLEDFILNYDKCPNLICFRVTNPEKPVDREYFVIDMIESTPKSTIPPIPL